MAAASHSKCPPCLVGVHLQVEFPPHSPDLTAPRLLQCCPQVMRPGQLCVASYVLEVCKFSLLTPSPDPTTSINLGRGGCELICLKPISTSLAAGVLSLLSHVCLCVLLPEELYRSFAPFTSQLSAPGSHLCFFKLRW